jgi:uncharacterized membrane protein YqjE
MSDKSGSSISAMINSMLEDVVALLRGHIELAKAEIKEGISSFLKSSVYLLIALSIGHLALILLLVTAGFALVAAGLEPWAAFLIVSLVLMALTGVFIWAGIRKFKSLAKSHRTVDAFTETADTLRSMRDLD